MYVKGYGHAGGAAQKWTKEYSPTIRFLCYVSEVQLVSDDYMYDGDDLGKQLTKKAAELDKSKCMQTIVLKSSNNINVIEIVQRSFV